MKKKKQKTFHKGRAKEKASLCGEVGWWDDSMILGKAPEGAGGRRKIIDMIMYLPHPSSHIYDTSTKFI